MSKDVNAIMNIKIRNHRGFSMVEFITAIGILGVLSAAVMLFMSSSSKTYSNLSVESQLQSEAQLVANMVTELAIDSYDAESSVEDFGLGYDNATNKQLVLESMVDGDKKQYIFGRKNSSNELYLAERTETAGSPGTWTAPSEALLGNYITDFTVDTSRVENENMLQFTLSYEKSGKTYDSKYQVLMRNRAYADKEGTSVPQQTVLSMAIKVDPQLIFIDIVNETVPRYYIGTVSAANARTLGTGSMIPFSSTVISNKKLTDKTVKWELKNEDSNLFEMSDETATTSNLKWNPTATNKFANSPIDAFTLVITKSMNFDGKLIEASPKTAQILLRRVKSVNLYALSGATQWKEDYAAMYGGVASPEAQGYAYTGANGKYLPINLSASIISSNIEYGGGLTWKLEMKAEDGSWGVCTDAGYASLQYAETTTGTNNTVTLGTRAKNKQVYRVTATSKFDNSVFATYTFGVAPSGLLGGDGFYSRGYYTNMSAFYNVDGEKPKTQNGSEIHAIDEIVFMKVTEIQGSFLSSTDDEICALYTTLKYDKNTGKDWKFYMDYDKFSFNDSQKLSFYSSSAQIIFVVGYYGTPEINPNYDPKLPTSQSNPEMIRRLYISDDGYSGEMAAHMKEHGMKDAFGNAVSSENITKEGQNPKYDLGAVKVTKISPMNELIVLEKGKDRNLYIKTGCYNILSPRSGRYYLGAYIGDMKDNLLESGKSDVNEFFSINMTSAYGDVNQYVDSASVLLTAKMKSAQKKYPTDPKTVRMAANDYYLITTNGEANSYTDYDVAIANVEGTDCYVPGPESTYTKNGLQNWNASAGRDMAETTIKGVKSDGTKVDAVVYKKAGKSYCKYGGKTYKYNMTYHFWAD